MPLQSSEQPSISRQLKEKTNKLLGLHAVSKSMGDKLLFESLELMLSPGQRIGLLGVNGSGKTTLLRLMNEEPRSTPERSRRRRTCGS